MKTIKEHLDNISIENMVNEDFVNPHLRKLVKQLRAKGNTFNNAFGHWALRWDQLDSSVVKEYPGGDDVDKIIRKNKPCIVLGLKDGEYKFYMDPDYDYHQIGNDGDFALGRREGQYAALNQCKKCDSVVIIDLNKAREDSDASDLRRDRNDSQLGMWLRNPEDFHGWHGCGSYEEWCKELAKMNIERYKRIIAKNHAEKDDEFAKVSERINDLLQHAMKISVDLSRGKESLEGKSYSVGTLLKKFYGQSHYDKGKRIGSDGILTIMSDYLKEKADLRSGHCYSPEYTEKRAKALLDNIVTLCNQAEASIKELEQ